MKLKHLVIIEKNNKYNIEDKENNYNDAKNP